VNSRKGCSTLNQFIKVKFYNFKDFLVLILPFLGFASFLVLKIHENFVNVPFYDEWIFMDKHISNAAVFNFSIQNMFSPHNEHVLAVNYLFYYISFWMEALDFSKLIFIFVVFSSASFLIILKQSSSLSTGDRILFSCLTGSTIFSVQNYENWTWPFQLPWFSMLFFSILSFYYLQKFIRNKRVVYLIPIICFSLVATLSMANGILSGLVCLIIIMFEGRGNIKIKKPIIYYFLGTIITFSFISVVLITKPWIQSIASWEKCYGRAILALDGFSVIFSVPIANFNFLVCRITGLVCLILLLFIVYNVFLKKKCLPLDCKNKVFFASLLLFVVSSCFLICLSRADLGGANYIFTCSRYTGLSGLIWPLVFYFTSISNKKNVIFKYVFFFSFFFLYLISAQESLKWWNHRRSINNQIQAAFLISDLPEPIFLNQFKTEIHNVGFINFSLSEKLRFSKANLFKKLGYTENTGQNIGHVDRVEAMQFDGYKTFYRITGWAGSKSSGLVTSVKYTNLYVDNELLGSPIITIPRLDVKNALLAKTDKFGWEFFSTNSKVLNLRGLYQK